MDLTADDGLTLAVFTTEAGSRSEQALNLLGSWAAALDSEPDPVAGSMTDRSTRT